MIFAGEFAQFCLVMMTTARHPASDLKYEATRARNPPKKWHIVSIQTIKATRTLALWSLRHPSSLILGTLTG